MNAITAIAIVVAIIAVAGVIFLLIERNRTRTLKSRFGPEYYRAVDQEGNPRRAHALLEKRQKRVEKYQLRPLSPEERARFVSEWKKIQEHFVDDPRDAIGRADGLVSDAMRTRGYPLGDFERQAADLSVDHPEVLGDYRVAHEIALRSEQGQATTEDLRLAMQHYRNLFAELANETVTREEVHH